MKDIWKNFIKNTPVFSVYVLISIFLLQGFYLINYGLSFPFLDDFRYYANPPHALPDSLSLSWLTQVANDTLSVVGFFIDYLILKITNGNFLIISVFSYFFILGFILAILGRIINNIVEDVFIKSLCILLMLFILTVGSYWGYQNIAYHQLLPILFGLLLLLFFQEKKIKPLKCSIFITLVVSIVLSMFTSLSYISGPFVVLSFSGVALLFYYLNTRKSFDDESYKEDVLVFIFIFLTGLSALVFQLYKIKTAQGSIGHVHTGDPLSTPFESRFWIFLFGLYGRASGYTGKSQYNYLIDIFAFLFINAPIFFLALYGFRKKYTDKIFFWNSIIILSISVGVFLYAGIVSAGRVGLLHSEDWSIISTLSKSRFHFWWLSLMPAISLCAYYLLVTRGDHNAPAIDNGRRLLLLVLFIIMVAPKNNVGDYISLWNYGGFYKDSYTKRAKGISCLAENLINNPEKIICSDFYPGNIAKSLSFTRSMNPIFMQILPISIPDFSTIIPTKSNFQKIGGICAIDIINDAVTRNAVVSKATNQLSIIGWAVDIENSSVPKTVIIQLATIDNDNAFYIETLNRIQRPDVINALNNSIFENSGFIATARLGKVPEGKYTLKILQPTPYGLLVCPNQGFIEIK